MNRQIVLAQVPDGVPEPKHFASREVETPAPSPGQFLSRTLAISLDPYVRGVISGRHMGNRLAIGDVVVGRTLARVEASNHPDYEPGELLLTSNGWQDYAISDGSEVRRVPDHLVPPTLALGLAGMPGLTAFAGIEVLGQPASGATVVVSAASGAVGSAVGQFAKLRGCRVVGIAGSEEKCSLAKRSFGFDGCINYKREDLAEALKAHCPDRVDLYFDNVAGETLAVVLTQLALHAKVILCGMMAQYNKIGEPPPGPALGPVIGARATLVGLVVYDHMDRWGELQEFVANHLASGRLAFKEDIVEGLDAAPEGFCRLMRGENVGKALVRVAEY